MSSSYRAICRDYGGVGLLMALIDLCRDIQVMGFADQTVYISARSGLEILHSTGIQSLLRSLFVLTISKQLKAAQETK